MHKRVLFDGRVLAHKSYSGVEYYASNLLSEIGTVMAIASPGSVNRYVQQLWEHTRLPYEAEQYDLLFCPANIAPLWVPRKTKLVLTLHDVAFKRFPQSFSPSFRRYYSFLVPKNIERADRIITVSEASKREIVAYYPQAESKLTVIPLGVDPLYRLLPEVKRQKQILFVGSVNERKNLIGVLEAFFRSSISSEYQLVIIGKRSSHFPVSNQLKKLLEAAENHPNIKFKSGLVRKELLVEYNASACLLFPSLYEGFGLPPLEAMACGTPVITSSISSMPEVCGDAALYCDPYNIDDIKKKIELLLSEKTLLMELRRKGLERAKSFTWKKAAEAHLQVFDEVLDR